MRGQLIKYVCLFLVAMAAVELLLLNIALIYIYRIVQSELSEIYSAHPSAPFFDKLQNNQKINSLITDAKTSGIFTSLLQNTLERLYIMHEHLKWTGQELVDANGRQMRPVSFIGIDVSHSREATYIYNRISSRKNFPYHFLVVDIGTNDGFISSNSFNFIQWGWDAVLVEPQATELKTAQNNLRSYIDKYNEQQQSVKFVQAAVGSKDGTIEFVITKASQDAESHVLSPKDVKKDGDTIWHVPSITVKTLAEKNKIPKNFGLLSIDAEGMGAEILKQWISQGFRPAYIIFEHLHKQEPIRDTMDYLELHDYHYLGTRGWNLIFEHFPSGSDNT